jgi:hypothetical protein
MEKQLKLFNISLPEEKLRNKRRKSLFYIEIIEKDGELLVFWKRALHLGQAKKLAAIEYNKNKGYIESNFVKFGKTRGEKERRTA